MTRHFQQKTRTVNTLLVKTVVDINSARILTEGHAFVVVSVSDPSRFRKQESNVTSMLQCGRDKLTKYVVPLESTASGMYAGWLPKDITVAIQEGRYMIVDPDASSMVD